jgi:hypothetical protein
MSNKSITLRTAITLSVLDLVSKNTKISTHDITRHLRDKVNKKEWEIPEIKSSTSQDAHLYDVKHAVVKSNFVDMVSNGNFSQKFDVKRKSNGLYFEYEFSPVTITSFVSNAPKIVPMQSLSSLISSLNGISVAPSSRVKPNKTITNPVPANTSGNSCHHLVGRIQTYLTNFKSNKIGLFPSVKQVQGAIKRGNKSTGVKCDELLTIISGKLGYSITKGNTYSTTYVRTI